MGAVVMNAKQIAYKKRLIDLFNSGKEYDEILEIINSENTVKIGMAGMKAMFKNWGLSRLKAYELTAEELEVSTVFVKAGKSREALQEELQKDGKEVPMAAIVRAVTKTIGLKFKKQMMSAEDRLFASLAGDDEEIMSFEDTATFGNASDEVGLGTSDLEFDRIEEDEEIDDIQV